jgi:hypothetical protein
MKEIERGKWIFDEEKYIQQLIRDPIELYPNSKLKAYIQKDLKKSGVILPKIP